MGNQGRDDAWQGSSWWTRHVRQQLTGWSYICMEINWEEELGSKTDHVTQGSSVGGKKLQNLWLYNSVGVSAVGGTLSLIGESTGRAHGVLECMQAHLPGNQHQKGTICLWVAGEVTESWVRAEQATLFPLRPLPHIQHHHAEKWVALSH